ncbi:hypothetical protein [Embleya sp. NBC_00896]|uniref:hypothetical protein n=1 Tax=Embleya sp. NBC_00896 TaxID=2975961 RepID=UPI002F90CB2D|nr:hypothetical protein OG928_35970 [Embleya sp. NBC_00896]
MNTGRMDIQAMEDARRWLAEDGVTQVGADEWTDGETPDGRLTGNEVAHEWAGVVFTDERLDAGGRLRLAFGMLDLLDDYWVTCEIGFAHRGPGGPLPAEVLWDGYRRRLEAPRVSEAVTYSLWVDWFEDRSTAATAFAEVLGRDIDQLTKASSDALLRRARRVLECSGPVPWPAKQATYAVAARLPVLRAALFKGLLTSYHDIYGSLEPDTALALIAELDLPADTEHLAALRTVLTAGHRNHYRSPGAWDDARGRVASTPEYAPTCHDTIAAAPADTGR